MPPRLRGKPRRGSSAGPRGRRGGRGGPEPRRIPPLATVAPSSPIFEESGPSLTSSLHSTRFHFQSQLNKPIISTLVTVIFSEEADDPASSGAASSEHSPSRTASSSQSRLMEAQLEVSAETQAKEDRAESQPQQSTPQKQNNDPPPVTEPMIDSAPARFTGNILHLVLPPGRTATDMEDNVMAEWVNLSSTPNQVGKHDNADSK